MTFLTPFQQKLLQKALQTEFRPEYRKRIEIMLLAEAGQAQAQICQALGCSHATARYWILIAQSGLAHQWDSTSIGRPKTISNDYCDRLRILVSQSPRELGYPFRRWTARWLNKQLVQEFGVQVSDRYISYLLKGMGLSTRQLNLAIAPTNDTTTIQIQDLQPASTESASWSLEFLQVSTVKRS